MILPRARTIWLIAGGAPVALVIGAAAPDLWSLGVGWVLLVVALAVADAVLAAGPPEFTADMPQAVAVGSGRGDIRLAVGFPARAPARVQAALALDTRLSATGRSFTDIPIAGGTGEALVPLVPARRGTAAVDAVWLRWSGPLGLVWRQRREVVGRSIAVLTDVSGVRGPALNVLLRDAMQGITVQRQRGEGAEFQALADYRPGMDRRAIDWTSSARHARLVAKEYSPERNNQIVFALDAGRSMCEPLAGVPRIDRAVSAALVAAYVALKSGDRTSVYGFAARPLLSSPFVADTRDFPRLQHAAAALDYRHEETNYTLGLSSLAGGLRRRSLIVVFTDFTDPAGAELMVAAAARLIARHLVLFVVMADAELEALIDAPPRDLADAARAVTAAGLLRQRRLVVTRLKRLGIDVVEAPHDAVGTRLVNAYLGVKRRGLL